MAEISLDKRRDENIKRNLQFLEDIGLGSRSSRASAAPALPPSKKRSHSGSIREKNEPTRRSMRIATVPVPNYKVQILSDRNFHRFCDRKKHFHF
jgi:hypothetical protein